MAGTLHAKRLPPIKPTPKPYAGRMHVPWYADVHAIADRSRGPFVAEFKAAVTGARNGLDATEWQALAAGAAAQPTHTSYVDDVVHVLTVAITPTVSALNSMLIKESGQHTLDAIVNARQQRAAASLAGAFSMISQRALDYVDTASGRLITSLSDGVRESVRDILRSSFEGNYDVRTTARLLEATVGLTPSQTQAVGRYYAAMVANPDINDDSAGAMATTYADKLLTYRAETIARTETIAAANAGVLEGFKQAVEQELLSPDTTKTWIVTPDDNLCPYCEELGDEEVGIDDEFSDGEDAPPDHASCRCCIGLTNV